MTSRPELVGVKIIINVLARKPIFVVVLSTGEKTREFWNLINEVGMRQNTFSRNSGAGARKLRHLNSCKKVVANLVFLMGVLDLSICLFYLTVRWSVITRTPDDRL